MYEIEDGIPIPPAKYGLPRKYRFHEMEVGQSFFVPTPQGETYSCKRQTKVFNAAFGYGRRHGMKFTTRREGDGVRVWRVE